ncbi:unnamed protein product [Schistocephalus solidus]|uniref:protein-serine/threonine phosphatase n=1 Tax=Schistocephalus solidus TaxID=70667 RepID=A0A0X3PG93_SCHSO|nr:unnamed protein product [Schistocephalus solidus]
MRLNQNFVKNAQHLTAEYCRQNRKLILACDMDETLLTESDDEQHVIIRPKALYMLKNLRVYYELCLITYSTRERARQILNMRLDPNGKLFNGRVLCREDVMAGFTNKQEAFFAHLPQDTRKTRISKVRSGLHGATVRPPAWPYVVILDDFPAAWSNLASCIPIRPFFVGAAAMTAVSGRPIPKLLAGECGYVLSVHRFLCKIHAIVFPKHSIQTMPSHDSGQNVADEQKREKKHTTKTKTTTPPTAYATLLNLRRRINSNQRFRNLCYLDPGHMLNLDTKAVGGAGERRVQSLYAQRIPISSFERKLT